MADTTATPLTGSIHGPYEDLALKSLEVLEIIIKDMPQDAKQQYWAQWLEFHKGLQTIAEKMDVFHLFTPKQKE